MMNFETTRPTLSQRQKQRYHERYLEQRRKYEEQQALLTASPQKTSVSTLLRAEKPQVICAVLEPKVTCASAEIADAPRSLYIFDEFGIKKLCPQASLDLTHRLNECQYVQPVLVGGSPPKKKYPPKKKKEKNKSTLPLITSTQLGQINRVVPYDRPIETTLRFNGALITDGSGLLSGRFSLRNPLRAFNGSGSYVNAVDFASLFDQYKVIWFLLQVEPTGATKGPIVTSFDYDSPDTSTPNYANIVNYGGYRIFASDRQYEIGSKIPNITSGFDTSTDPPTALVVHQGGWIDAATPAAPGNMFIGGQNLGNSVTIANFVATMRILWRFRR
jgi:hypothetical protein